MDKGSWLISGSEGRWALGAIWDVRWKWRLENGIPECGFRKVCPLDSGKSGVLGRGRSPAC